MERPFENIRPDLDFNAEGKGPLSLPRMTSLGPGSQASDNIGDIVFRGASIRQFNNDEFVDNAIAGRMREMWVSDTEEIAYRYDMDTEGDYFPHANVKDVLIDNFRIGPEDLNKFGVDGGNKKVPVNDLVEAGLIEKHIQRPVTGGLSKRLGTSIRFARPGYDSRDIETLPLILFLEKDRIEANLVDVEYDDEFKQEHPLIAGAVDKGSKMFSIKSFEEDRLLYFYAVDEDTDTGTEDSIMWFANPLDDFNRLSEEDELMAYTGSIGLDKSLFGAAIYLTERRLTNFADEHIKDTETIKQQAEKLYPIIQSSMNEYSDRLVLVYHSGSYTTLDTGMRQMGDEFEWLYDGEQFIEDYNEAVPFTDPRKF